MPFFIKALAILIGSIFLSIGINFFLVPFHILDGGLIGIGLIFKYILGVKAGLTIIIFSLPIFTLAWFKYRRYFYNSLHGLLISSFMIDLLQPLRYYFLSLIHIEAFVSAIIGGILIGIGIGIMLRYETSTGGTDLLAQFFSKLFSINVGIVIFLIDMLVIGLGGILLSSETFLLSIVSITAVGVTTSILTLNIAQH